MLESLNEGLRRDRARESRFLLSVSFSLGWKLGGLSLECFGGDEESVTDREEEVGDEGGRGWSARRSTFQPSVFSLFLEPQRRGRTEEISTERAHHGLDSKRILLALRDLRGEAEGEQGSTRGKEDGGPVWFRNSCFFSSFSFSRPPSSEDSRYLPVAFSIPQKTFLSFPSGVSRSLLSLDFKSFSSLRLVDSDASALPPSCRNARMTYYYTDVGLGACGQLHQNSEYTLAMNSNRRSLSLLPLLSFLLFSSSPFSLLYFGPLR